MNEVVKNVLTIIIIEEEGGKATTIINRQNTINDCMISAELKNTEEEDERGDAIVGPLIST